MKHLPLIPNLFGVFVFFQVLAMQCFCKCAELYLFFYGRQGVKDHSATTGQAEVLHSLFKKKKKKNLDAMYFYVIIRLLLNGATVSGAAEPQLNVV